MVIHQQLFIKECYTCRFHQLVVLIGSIDGMYTINTLGMIIRLMKPVRMSFSSFMRSILSLAAILQGEWPRSCVSTVFYFWQCLIALIFKVIVFNGITCCIRLIFTFPMESENHLSYVFVFKGTFFFILHNSKMIFFPWNPIPSFGWNWSKS